MIVLICGWKNLNLSIFVLPEMKIMFKVFFFFDRIISIRDMKVTNLKFYIVLFVLLAIPLMSPKPKKKTQRSAKTITQIPL